MPFGVDINKYSKKISLNTFYIIKAKLSLIKSTCHLSLMYWLFPELALPANNQGWPEDFGFKLGGDGPSYILSVVEGSSAYMAGLQPGDQVLEIDGQDVSSLSTKALIALAQTLKTVPPSIGVVSRIEQASFSSLTCLLMSITKMN